MRPDELYTHEIYSLAASLLEEIATRDGDTNAMKLAHEYREIAAQCSEWCKYPPLIVKRKEGAFA